MDILKFIIITLVSLTSCTYSIPFEDSRQAREVSSLNRQYGAYTNNVVVNRNPNNSDQSDDGSVPVTFDPNNLDQQQFSGIDYRHEQESIQDHIQQQQQQHLQVDNNPESQLFNVGYSVKFTNGQLTRQLPSPQPSIQPKYSRAGGLSLDDGEIITGTRKRNEEVQLPYDTTSEDDYTSAAVFDSKKHKISGIRPKANKYAQNNGNYQNSKVLLSQANLSPKTQKYYKVLEQVKITTPTNAQDLQKYSWRHLSPGVEIIKSTEVPVINEKSSNRIQSPYNNFDHARALGRSQDFDYTNAVDPQNHADQNNLFYNQFNNVRNQVTQSLPVGAASTKTNQHFQVASAPPTSIKVKIPQLPIDTSLLRSHPVLTTNLQADLNNPSVIPIRIDTRLIHDAVMKEIATSNSNKHYVYPQLQDGTSLVQNFRNYYAVNQNPYGQQQQPRYQNNNYYEKTQSIGRYAEEEGQRRPRYTPEYNLQTNLRPPPVSSFHYHNGISYKN